MPSVGPEAEAEEVRRIEEQAEALEWAIEHPELIRDPFVKEYVEVLKKEIVEAEKRLMAGQAGHGALPPYIQYW